MAQRVGVLCGTTIKIDFVNDFLDIESLNNESKSLVIAQIGSAKSHAELFHQAKADLYFDMATKLCAFIV